MIMLAADCLLFRLANGESVALRAEMITLEVAGAVAPGFDAEFVNHAASAVFHYFKHELKREAVSLAEFAEALGAVLRGFASAAERPVAGAEGARVLESDLGRLAREAGDGELFFFPKLREELRSRLHQAPRLVRFRGLRGCVKQLSGVRRWSRRCQSLQDQIVEYLRGCFVAEVRDRVCALVVE